MRLPTLDVCPTLVLSANTILHPCMATLKEVPLHLHLSTWHPKPNPSSTVPTRASERSLLFIVLSATSEKLGAHMPSFFQYLGFLPQKIARTHFCSLGSKGSRSFLVLLFMMPTGKFLECFSPAPTTAGVYTPSPSSSSTSLYIVSYSSLKIFLIAPLKSVVWFLVVLRVVSHVGISCFFACLIHVCFRKCTIANLSTTRFPP